MVYCLRTIEGPIAKLFLNIEKAESVLIIEDDGPKITAGRTMIIRFSKTADGSM